MDIKPMENVYTDDYIGLVKLKARVDVLVEMLKKDKFVSVDDTLTILGYEGIETPK